MGKKGQKKGKGSQEQQAPVSETARIQLSKTLEDFRNSEAQGLSFCLVFLDQGFCCFQCFDVVLVCPLGLGLMGFFFGVLGSWLRFFLGFDFALWIGWVCCFFFFNLSWFLWVNGKFWFFRHILGLEFHCFLFVSQLIS